MIPTILLALAISWPQGVEVSTGATCRVMLSGNAAGDCIQAFNRQAGKAYWWRACGYVEWDGRGPHGEDIVAEKPLWAGESRHKAMGKCEEFLKAYEKRRGATR